MPSIQYYANRARGGAALIVTEPVSAARFQQAPHKVRVWDPESEPGLKRWAEAVEREDCRLLAQIQDPGRGRHERGRNPEAVGTSALPDDLSWTVPYVLSSSDIERTVIQISRTPAVACSGTASAAWSFRPLTAFVPPVPCRRG